MIAGLALAAVGAAAFVLATAGEQPQRAWQAYLINFLLWSAIAQAGLLFSAVMHITHARWSGPLSGLASAFTAFFPISFVLFLILFAGKSYIFPWMHQDLHGKEVWLNVPFVFLRDGIALLVLYGIGGAYLACFLRCRIRPGQDRRPLRAGLLGRNKNDADEPPRAARYLSPLSVLYIVAYALVLSLLGYDLVMAADPHWVSTLFGAYTFVKAFYAGLGALIILAGLVYLRVGKDCGLTAKHFHDVGKLFFAFCLLWADFFYVQLVVIWYGNIPEETAYVIERTMAAPWKGLAWTVLTVCFIAPFLILLNKRIKTRPGFMIVLCTIILAGIWLEHLLLLGPALTHGVARLPLGLSEGLITLGFAGLMIMAVAYFLSLFPELVFAQKKPESEIDELATSP
jgi:hypothetical protein